MLFLSLWYRKAKHVERIKCDWNFTTLKTFYSRFKLPIEKINKNTFFSPFEAIPELLTYFAVRSVIWIFILNIGLLWDSIQVLMQSFEKKTKHFLWIMLCESLELSRSPSNNFFDIPWRYIFLIAHIHISEKLCIFISQTATCTQLIASINMILINVEEEKLNQRLCIRKAL